MTFQISKFTAQHPPPRHRTPPEPAVHLSIGRLRVSRPSSRFGPLAGESGKSKNTVTYLLRRHFQKLLHFIKVYKNGQNQLNTRTIHFFLEHLFAPSSDEYSFGTYTKNITEIANKYTGCFLLDRFRFVTDEKELETVSSQFLTFSILREFQNAVCLMDTHQYFTGIVFNIDSNATEFDGFTTYKIRHYPEMVDCKFVIWMAQVYSRPKGMTSFIRAWVVSYLVAQIFSRLTKEKEVQFGSR